MDHLFVLLQKILPQHFLSRVIGRIGNARAAWVRTLLIKLFIARFSVDLSEAAVTAIGDYGSFNEFFTRNINTSQRPISGKVSSPADGTVSMCGHLNGNQMLQAKGMSYSLEKLLASENVEAFKAGSYLTIYLSPRDYHRVHMPIAATLESAQYIPGKLFSVNHATTARVPDLFAANERLVMRFDSELGPVAIVMVGAMIVAGIKPVWRDTLFTPGKADRETFDPPKQFNQGAELGHFEMGSTVIAIFQRQLDWTIGAGNEVRMGQAVFG